MTIQTRYDYNRLARIGTSSAVHLQCCGRYSRYLGKIEIETIHDTHGNGKKILSNVCIPVPREHVLYISHLPGESSKTLPQSINEAPLLSNRETTNVTGRPVLGIHMDRCLDIASLARQASSCTPCRQRSGGGAERIRMVPVAQFAQQDWKESKLIWWKKCTINGKERRRGNVCQNVLARSDQLISIPGHCFLSAHHQIFPITTMNLNFPSPFPFISILSLCVSSIPSSNFLSSSSS